MRRRRLKKRGDVDRRDKKRRLPKPRELGIGHDTVNEQVLIALACTDSEWFRKTLPRLPSDSFFGKGHAEAIVVLQEIARRGMEFGWDTVRQIAGDSVDVEYLQQLVEARPRRPPNLKHHISMLQWDRARVEAGRGPLQGLLKAIADPTAEPRQVVAFAKSLVGCLEGHGGEQRYLRDPNALIRDLDRSLTERREGIAVYPFGWRGLDFYDDGRRRMIPGTKPGKQTLIVGESGSGKSALASWIVLGLIGRGDVEVEPRRGIYCAWEMGGEDSIELLAVQDLGLSRTKYLTGEFNRDEQDEMLERAEDLLGYVSFMEMPFDRLRGDHQVTNDERLDTIHAMIEDTGAQWAIFDLWQRALYDTRPGPESQALKRQQSIAKETHCHCILLHHLRKDDIGRHGPTRASIKGPTAWIDTVDNAIGVHRSALSQGGADVTAELKILKQRFGVWPLAIECEWDGDRGSFEEFREIPFDTADSDDNDLDGFFKQTRGKGR